MAAEIGIVAVLALVVFAFARSTRKATRVRGRGSSHRLGSHGAFWGAGDDGGYSGDYSGHDGGDCGGGDGGGGGGGGGGDGGC